MLQRLTTPELLEFAYQQIAELFRAHAEWLFVPSDGAAHSLLRDELEIAVVHGKLVLSCWTEQGTRWWHILAWEWNGQLLELETSRRMGRERRLMQLVPRASAKYVTAAISAARQLRCERLAQLAASFEAGSTIERLSLSRGSRHGQPGRYAQVLLLRRRARFAVTGPIVPSPPATVDAFLSSSLLWFRRTSNRTKPPWVEQLWLIVSPELLKPLLYRIALLRDGLRDSIRLFSVDDDLAMLVEESCPDKTELWRKKLARFPPVAAATLSELSAAFVAEAPEAIDVVHARHGETLRYYGLPFARVRTLLGRATVWFGIDRAHRRLLEETTWNEWLELLNDLRQHRSATSVDHRHAFYRSAPEAWLESMLRRDITRLDPGLIIAPLHAQFRTARGAKLGIRPIDLLALRQDGRLVVIELKVSEDREHVLQGADYWRRVEAHRRRGHIAKAKLFGERTISDESPLVYLVAPTLCVHPSFQTLAQCISSDIEIYRFDINEDWRSGVRVMRRLKA